MVVRGSFESTVVSAYYGRGPADGFFRKYFNMGVQDVVNLYEGYVVTLEKGNSCHAFLLRIADNYQYFVVGTRKPYQSEMVTEIVRMITQGLRKLFFLSTLYRLIFHLYCLEELTGVSNLTMSYLSFAKKIAIPYKVNIAGWPDDVPRAYPQRLTAEQTKTLYDAWKTAQARWYRMTAAEARLYEKQAEKNGDLEVRARKKRSRGTQDSDDGSTEDEDEGVPKRRSPANNDLDDQSEDNVRPQKKLKSTASKDKSGGKRGAGKKSAGMVPKKSSGKKAGNAVAGGKKMSAGGAGASRKLSGDAGGSKKPAAAKSKKGAAKKKNKSDRFIVTDSEDDRTVNGNTGDDHDEDDAEFSGDD